MITKVARVILKYVLLIVFYILLIDCQAFACRRTMILSGECSLNDQLIKENCIYLVGKAFDLKGETIEMPNNCCLKFEGGRIDNGTIVGLNTEVISDRNNIFARVAILGTWSNTVVYSEWLDFIFEEKVDNAINFRNLMQLCNGEKMTHLYMQSGTLFCSVASAEYQEVSNISVPSNVYWHNSATICQLATDISKSSLVLLHKSTNVTIEGGEFVGDVKNHLGSIGEWGHGIKLAGASNVVLRNLVSREFWGDGIDLLEGEYNGTIRAGIGPCENITIDNVKCILNRRQGISIEAARKVVIRYSEFAYTGKIKMTAPGCGVDIEPWCANEVKIQEVRFYNCFIHDNNPLRDFCLEPNSQSISRKKFGGNQLVNKIDISKCQTGRIYLHGANTVTINDCVIEEISHYSHGQNIIINSCTIKKKNDLGGKIGLTMKKCK